MKIFVLEGKMIFKEYVVKDLHFLTVLKEKCVVVIGEEDIY